VGNAGGFFGFNGDKRWPFMWRMWTAEEKKTGFPEEEGSMKQVEKKERRVPGGVLGRALVD